MELIPVLRKVSSLTSYKVLTTEESCAHPVYKWKLVECSGTEYTNVFGRAGWPGATQHVLVTPFFGDWRSLPENEDESNQPVIGSSTIHGVLSFSFSCSFTPNTQENKRYLETKRKNTGHDYGVDLTSNGSSLKT